MKTKRSTIAAEIAQGLEEILAFEQGKISLKTSKVQIPAAPRRYTAAEIRELRDRLRCSQAVFARMVGVSADSVRSWEQGIRRPSGAAARVLEFLDQPALLQKFVKLRRSGAPASVGS